MPEEIRPVIIRDKDAWTAIIDEAFDQGESTTAVQRKRSYEFVLSKNALRYMETFMSSPESDRVNIRGKIPRLHSRSRPEKRKIYLRKRCLGRAFLFYID